MSRTLFIGFWYGDPYLALYSQTIPTALRTEGWEAIMPLGGVAQGMMLDRIRAMIEGSERAAFEVGEENGNVWFELGMSLGRRQPVALLTGSPVRELPDILRSPWLRHYESHEDCTESVLGFIQLTDPEPLVAPSKGVAEERTVVVGNGPRAEQVLNSLRNSGRTATLRLPSTILSLAEAVSIADGSATLILVRPESEAWKGPEAIAGLSALGAAFALHRQVVVAAGTDEFVPSDCIQLVVRASNSDELAIRVIESLEPKVATLPLSGTMRPRIVEALLRPLCSVLTAELNDRGCCFLAAEPGYGKTTLLNQVAQEVHWPVAWVNVQSTWSASQLLEALVAAVGQHVPAFGWTALSTLRDSNRRADSVLNMGTQREPISPEQLAELLATQDLKARSTPVLLVIDDIHRANDETDRLLARLVEVCPPWLRLALAGRQASPSLSALTAKAIVPSWGAEDLKFSSEETTFYLRQKIPGLSDEHVELLTTRTEGWPVALAVIRAWLTSHQDAPIETIRTMTRGDRQAIYQLFAHEFFVGLDEETQRRLRLISLPTRLDAVVAIQLLGQQGGLQLRDLVQGPYFLTEDEVGSFRMHSLFREFLGQRWTDEFGRPSLLSARSSLAHWYHSQDDDAAAYQMACDAEEWDLAVTAIEPIVRTFANHGEAQFLHHLLQPLPIKHIRQSRPVWESWVRALAYVGATEALDEARLLVETPTTRSGDTAIAELVLLELLHNRGHSTDDEMADACSELASRFQMDQPSLALQARLFSVTTRSAKTSEAEQWRMSRQEAIALANSAEEMKILSVAAVAWATAADLGQRLFETELREESTRLSVLEKLGNQVPLAERLSQANRFMAGFNEVSEQFKRAFDNADQAREPIVRAQVELQYGRFLTFEASQHAFRIGMVDDEIRNQVEDALKWIFKSAETYREYGIPRSVAIAFNAAGQSASVLGDKERRSTFIRQATEIAERFGYQELSEAAFRIAQEQTIPDILKEIKNQLPFHQRTTAFRREYIDKVVAIAGITPDEELLVRPSLERQFAALSKQDAEREATCQYLNLYMEPAGQRIGSFSLDPLWHVVCRMRGLTSLIRHRRAEPLLDQFTAGVCSGCEFRKPGPATPIDKPEDWFAPLWKRLNDPTQPEM